MAGFFPQSQKCPGHLGKIHVTWEKKYLKIWKIGQKRTKKKFFPGFAGSWKIIIWLRTRGGVSEGPKVAATWKKASWLGWTPPPVGCLPTLKKPLGRTPWKKMRNNAEKYGKYAENMRENAIVF